MNGLTISPTRSANCSTRPFTPARTTVLSSSTWAWASAASALAFWAGRSDEIRASAACFAAVAAAIAAQAAFDKNLELLDFALRDDTRIASLQLLLGLQFVHGLLVRALGLLDLAFSLQEIGLRHHQLRLDLRNLAPRGLHSRLLLRAVQPEDRRSFGDWTAKANIDLGDAPV